MLSGPTSADVETILTHRHDLGGDWWTTPDRRLLKGSPFSTVECVDYLLELGVEPDDPALRGAIDLVLGTWRPDGRFALYPTGAILPCQTAGAARLLCRAGYADDPRVRTTLRHLLTSRWDDSGWRCTKFPYGRGPQTEHSNPHPTLVALDAFRFTEHAAAGELDASVEMLLGHWETRVPIGPCQYGIGSRFLQVEYPFRTYNLFGWVYVLSFYAHARTDPRFLDAFETLRSRTVDGQVVPTRVAPALRTLAFCAPGRPSARATRRYEEIRRNLGV